jgi:hypothetical protein
VAEIESAARVDDEEELLEEANSEIDELPKVDRVSVAENSME